MKVETSQVSKLMIADVPRLDPITVLLEDLGPNQGKMIVECYGRSWSAYWGDMGSKLVPFLKSVSTDYVARRMYHGDIDVYDPDGLEEQLKKEVLRQRRQRDIGQNRARGLWDDIEAADFEHPFHIRSDIMTMLIGDDWHCCLPMKPHSDFVYLVRVIEAVRAGVAEAYQVNEFGLPMDPDSRMLRAGRHLFEFAQKAGWQDDGEGAFEFVQRTSYRQGLDDAKEKPDEE